MQGERLSAEVACIRTGSVLLDTSIRVFGPGGQLLAAVDDTPLYYQDPFVTLLAPEDGKYVVEVQGTNRDGDENSRYLLSLGDFPRPAAVYPPGAQIGTQLAVQFRGDARGDFEQQIDLSSDRPVTHGLVASRDGREAPSAIPFRVSAFPNVLEDNPRSTPVPLPAAFNGVLRVPDERDAFAFFGLQSRTNAVRSFGYRIGSPVDTVISILDEQGEELVSNDDDGSHDSRLVFVPPRPGTYRLEVRDKRRAGRLISFTAWKRRRFSRN